MPAPAGAKTERTRRGRAHYGKDDFAGRPIDRFRCCSQLPQENRIQLRPPYSRMMRPYSQKNDGSRIFSANAASSCVTLAGTGKDLSLSP